MRLRLAVGAATLSLVGSTFSGAAALADDRSRPAAATDCFEHGVRLIVGDHLTCVAGPNPSGRQSNTGGGISGYKPAGTDFPIKGNFGTPAIPPDPKGDKCASITGYGSQDQPPPIKLYEKDGRMIGRFDITAHWHTGYGGPDGVSVAPLDVFVNPDGTGGFVGRELFEGTVDGRTGAMVHWVEGTFDSLEAGGRYVGYNYTIRGMEGLTGIQQKGYFVGVFAKGYEWVEPGMYCWNGFDGMYNDDGSLKS